MPNLPPGHRLLQCVVRSVTYQGSYWVDGHVIYVLSEYGQSSTDGLRSGTNRQRDRENGERAHGLFETMIRRHLVGYKVP